MNRYKFKNVERISKTQAKKYYEKGFDVLFIPCKCNPENDFFSLGIWENAFLRGQHETFEKLENAFSYYNNRTETGKYTAFYISKTEETFIHFEFVNGSNPYIFRGVASECFAELKKWSKNWNIETLKQGFYRLKEKQHEIL